jgi:hypothetical protein
VGAKWKEELLDAIERLDKRIADPMQVPFDATAMRKKLEQGRFMIERIAGQTGGGYLASAALVVIGLVLLGIDLSNYQQADVSNQVKGSLAITGLGLVLALIVWGIRKAYTRATRKKLSAMEREVDERMA